MEGIKFDQEKDQWHLLPLWMLRPVIRVLMYGGSKYAPFNWQKVVSEPGGVDRYLNACLRHIADYQQGERIEAQSKQSPIANAICCLIFILWHDLQADLKAHTPKT